MKRFKFSLQTVHDVRVTAKDEAERALSAAMADVSRAEAELVETRRVRDESANELSAQYARGDLDPREAVFHFGFLDALARREAESRVKLNGLERARERAREATVRASREAEVTSKLRDRHFARHQAEAVRAEQAMIDELVVIGTARKRAEERV